MLSLPTLILVFAAVFLADHLLERAFAGDYQAIAVIDGMLACGVCIAVIKLLGRQEEQAPASQVQESRNSVDDEPAPGPVRPPKHLLPCKRFNRGKCFARFGSCKYSHHCSVCNDISAQHSAVGEDCPGPAKAPATRGSRRRGKKRTTSEPTGSKAVSPDPPEAEQPCDRGLKQLGRWAA
mmetsp:Transcript_21407/g.51959  ORF Transcript_21407/g.51959 Transcript_21407/m.51959 type:complete len:180 (-) Transcript_21407:66-605(-)